MITMQVDVLDGGSRVAVVVGNDVDCIRLLKFINDAQKNFNERFDENKKPEVKYEPIPRRD